MFFFGGGVGRENKHANKMTATIHSGKGKVTPSERMPLGSPRKCCSGHTEATKKSLGIAKTEANKNSDESNFVLLARCISEFNIRLKCGLACSLKCLQMISRPLPASLFSGYPSFGYYHRDSTKSNSQCFSMGHELAARWS